MRLPPFTLVHKRTSLRGLKSENDVSDLKLRLLKVAEPELCAHLDNVKPRLRRTVLNSTFALGSPEEVPTLKWVAFDLNRQSHVTTVGIWDLGTHAGFLPRLIEKLNLAQSAFTFFKVQAAIPAGMVSRPQRVAVWARENLGRQLTKDERDEIENNIISEDFFARAEQVRREVGVDYLIGVTPSMVAFTEDDWTFWNYFSDSKRRTILASAYGVNEFSQKAGRPFEVAIAFIAIGQLLVELSTQLEFHEDRGCLFDENKVRQNIVNSLKELRIETDCLQLVASPYRAAALVMMDALKTYSREDKSVVLADFGTSQPEQTWWDFMVEKINEPDETIQGATSQAEMSETLCDVPERS